MVNALKWSTLLISLCVVTSLFADSSFENTDYTVQVNFTPRATFFVSEFYNKFNEGQPFEDIVAIQITNKTSDEKELIFRVRAFSDSIGSESDPVIDAYLLPENAIAIPAGQTSVYNPSTAGNSAFRINNMNANDIVNKVVSQYGANLLTDFAGMAPQGTYTYILTIHEKTDTAFSSPVAGPITEAISVPLEYGIIQTISPMNQDSISSYPINFVWSPLVTRASVDVHYILRIWDQDPLQNAGVQPRVTVGASGSALTPNDELKNQTTFLYFPLDYSSLTPGNTYYWQVLAKDSVGYLIGLGEGSNINQFTMQTGFENAQVYFSSLYNGQLVNDNHDLRWLSSVSSLDQASTLYYDISIMRSGTQIYNERVQDSSFIISNAQLNLSENEQLSLQIKGIVNNAVVFESEVIDFIFAPFEESSSSSTASTTETVQQTPSETLANILKNMGLPQEKWQIKQIKKNGQVITMDDYLKDLADAAAANNPIGSTSIREAQ